MKTLTIDTAELDRVPLRFILETAYKRPRMSLTPNLVNLRVKNRGYSKDLDIAYLFLSETIRTAHFTLTHDSVANGLFLLTLAKRAPNIEALSVRLPSSTEPLGCISQMGMLFMQLPSLKTVQLPLYMLSGPLASDLSSCPNILHIGLLPHFDDCTKSEAVVSFSSHLPTDSFPSLTVLQMAVGLDDMTQFLSHSGETLMGLHVLAVSTETAGSIHTFLTALSSKCTKLESLRMDLIPEKQATRIRNNCVRLFIQNRYEDMVTLSTLEPVRLLAALQAFRLSYHAPLYLTNSDVDEFLRGWTSLRSLGLNCDPVHLKQKPTLNAAVIPVIAKHCPLLRSLSLYIDCSAIQPESQLINTKTSSRFRCLEKINFGVTDMRVCDSLALSYYLSRLCPRTCVFASHTSWYKDVLKAMEEKDEDFLAILSWGVNNWNTFEKSLDLFNRAREEGLPLSS